MKLVFSHTEKLTSAISPNSAWNTKNSLTLRPLSTQRKINLCDLSILCAKYEKFSHAEVAEYAEKNQPLRSPHPLRETRKILSRGGRWVLREKSTSVISPSSARNTKNSLTLRSQSTLRKINLCDLSILCEKYEKFSHVEIADKNLLSFFDIRVKNNDIRYAK